MSPRAQLHPLLVLVLSPALYTKVPGRSHVDPKVVCEPVSAPLDQVQKPLEETSLRWQHSLFPTSVPLSGKLTMVAIIHGQDTTVKIPDPGGRIETKKDHRLRGVVSL